MRSQYFDETARVREPVGRALARLAPFLVRIVLGGGGEVAELRFLEVERLTLPEEVVFHFFGGEDDACRTSGVVGCIGRHIGDAAEVCAGRGDGFMKKMDVDRVHVVSVEMEGGRLPLLSDGGCVGVCSW